MAGSPVDTAFGITLSFATSSFTAQIKDISWPSMSRDAHETTHQGTALAGANEFGNRTFIPSDLSDPGEVTVEMHFNADTVPPTDAATEVMTMTWPKVAADTTAPIWTASVFCTSYDPGAVLGDVMTASATWKVTGPVAITAAT